MNTLLKINMPKLKINFLFIQNNINSYRVILANSNKFAKAHFSTMQSSSNNSKRNFPKHLEEKMQLNLYTKKNHPLNIIRNRIVNFFEDEKFIEQRTKISTNNKILINEDLPKIVDLKDNFFDLLVDPSHETLSPKNTYYWDDERVLRTHMTAHDVKLLKGGRNYFLSIGDVYRRDEIDATHYPIFHQVDSVRVFDKKELLNMENPYKNFLKESYENDLKNSDPKILDELESKEVKENKEQINKLNSNIDKDTQHCLDIVTGDLKYTLQNLNRRLFGDVKLRWVNAYFPFTHPSYELEIFFNGKWMEVLGCGIMRDGIIKNAGLDPNEKLAWAFGMGLERLAMRLFDIKDIRLFWSTDERFSKQFKDDKISQFKPYSKFPACYKDFSFFVDSNYNENDFFELIRVVAGDLVENVKCMDTFTKDNKTSKCYRVLFRHMDKSLSNEEINILQDKIRKNIVEILNLKLR